ncbi:dienelactone hydrolase family protein [Micromonospora sp. NPDC047793]|uniref:dienelactone hydrolase family protein n=1 Tax=unclassified Micromonospora TaxID=2617518 RepID=UPI0033F14427
MDVRGGEVTIPAGQVELSADLLVPTGTSGAVLFAHGSGSSRHSPRNVSVAHRLTSDGLGTVLVDLLTRAEDEVDAVTAELRFDIGLLADRLVATLDWLAAARPFGAVPIGLFGASTGAAAALIAAARRPDMVHAVVSRGGRPDLAGAALGEVRAATLLLVGGLDEQVITLNEQARDRMAAPTDLRVVPGATHLFEEPGTLEQVAEAAAGWFRDHLRPQPVPASG